MANDVFCKIINNQIKADIIAETDDWMAIRDIHPQAPIHILVIPKKHIGGIESSLEEDSELLGKLLMAVKIVAQKIKLKNNGYRVVINQGSDGGQVVDHLHLHILGGKPLGPKIVV